MKKRILFLFILFGSGFFHSAPLSAQDFVIRSFHADIAIHGDSELSVQETIEVEFKQPKHGIYRDIPFRYEDERGGQIRIPITVLSVTGNSGETLPYRVKKHGNVMNVRIGDPDSYVEGRKTYIITYTAMNAILFFDDHDELYWNVTGNIGGRLSVRRQHR